MPESKKRRWFIFSIVVQVCIVLLGVGFLLHEEKGVELLVALFTGISASLFASLIFFLAFPDTTIIIDTLIVIRKQVQRLLQGRIWVTSPRADVEETSFYEEYYDDAREIVVTGIACKHFTDSLCPKGATRVQRLNLIKKGRLFDNLSKRGLVVTVYLVDPFCEYAKIRSLEEGNPNCVADISDTIDRVRAMRNDLHVDMRGKNREKWRITGSLSIFLMSRNPYFSLFQVKPKDHALVNTIFIGLLAQGMPGLSCPMIAVSDHREQGDIVQKCTQHLGTLHHSSRLLFEWKEGIVEFHE